MTKTFQKQKPKQWPKVGSLGPIEKFHFDGRIGQILSLAPTVESVLYTKNLADWLGVSIQCVKVWRLRKTGPPHGKQGSCPAYSREIIEKWLKERQAFLIKSAAK